MELDVRHIARLARLEIPPEKLGEIGEDLAAIVKMLENLPPPESIAGLPDTAEKDAMLLREDVVCPSLGREAILRNAPEVSGGFFVVPNVI